MTPDGHFWLSGAITFAALVWLLIRTYSRRALSGLRLEAEAATLILLTMLCWRWPAMWSLYDFNPDESQLAAGAITLLHDPVYWRAVDGTTSGPVNFFALAPFLAMEALPPVFATRLGGLVFLWGALAMTFAFLRRSSDAPTAVLGLLPAWMFAAMTTDWDFIHCSSELVSLPLIAGSALLMLEATRTNALPSGWCWRLSALCAGLLPWAKLQSAPLAAAIAATAAMVIAFRSSGMPLAARLRALVTYATWSLAPAVVFLGMAVFSGQWRHLYESYIVNNLLYATVRTDVGAAVTGLKVIVGSTGFFPALLVATFSSLLVGLLGAAICRPHPRLLIGMGLLGGAVASYSILKPALPAPHYLFYLVLPCAWLTAAGVQFTRVSFPRIESLLIVLVVSSGVFLPGLLRCNLEPPDGSVFSNQRHVPDDERLVRIINAFAAKGDTLAVWGWAPRLFVGSRLPQGTRDGNAARQIQHSDKRDSYYRPRFIEDMKRNQPAIFVDAVGPGRFDFRDRKHQAHDAFADMAAVVRESYTLVGDYYNTRLYLRSDLPGSRPERIHQLERELHQAIEDGSAQWEWPLPAPAFPTRYLYRRHAWHMQTPAEFGFSLQGDEQAFYFSFGMDPRCYIQGATDGAMVLIELRIPGRTSQILFQRTLNPRGVSADRGVNRGSVLLPSDLPQGSSLVVRALPGASEDFSWDWVFFSEPRFARTLLKPVKP